MASDNATARRVNRLGLGLAALGRPAYLTSGRDRDVGDHRSVDEMRARTAEVLDAAYAGGIRYVDAARSYGRSEEFLADWLNSWPHATDVQVASKEVFANGRLAPGSADPAAAVQQVTRVAAECGMGVDQLAMAAAVSQPWAPRVLSGAVTVSQIESHLSGADVDVPGDVLDGLTGVSEDPADYWTARSRRPWS